MKQDGRKKERTDKQKAAFALMAERRRTLNESKKTSPVTKVPKKKTMERKAESESESSEEDVKPKRKSKGKGPTNHYNYFYGPTPMQNQERLPETPRHVEVKPEVKSEPKPEV